MAAAPRGHRATQNSTRPPGSQGAQAGGEVGHLGDRAHPLVDLLFRDGQSSLGLIERLSAVGVRVVVMTGLSLEAPPVRQALAAGACSALAKPFSLDAVRALVRGVTPD